MSAWWEEYITLIEDCEKRSERLTGWECSFIDSLKRQVLDDKGPTTKQIEILDRIWEKATVRR